MRRKTDTVLQEDKPAAVVEEDRRAYDRQDFQETEEAVSKDSPKPRHKAGKSQKATEHGRFQEPSRRESEDVPKTQGEKRPIGPTERREPENRGGRPRGPSPPSPGKTEAPSPRPPKTEGELKPEIVCWKRESQWVLGVEVEGPEELLEKQGLRVSQNHVPLEQDDLEQNRWLLRQIQGEVSVRWGENGVSNICNDKEYLLFKLGVLERDWGRCVKSCSTGVYLAVVPGSWERDEELSGYAFIEPENTCLEGYKAHFFDLRNNGKISFRTLGVIGESRIRFELVGHRINDASEEYGPLFGQTLPRIKAGDDIWHLVGTIVVGEEGPGKGRWRKSFNPAAGVVEQELPSEIADRKSGWYYLRIYDKNDDLIDSLDYRFVGGLKDLRILLSSPLPPTEGYDSVQVEFCHEPGCTVAPDSSDMNGIQIEHEDNKTILIVPPDPAYDRTKWIIISQDGLPVAVTVLVERVWWALGSEDQPPIDWEDKPIILSRDRFAATSNSMLWLKLPRRRWIDRVLVGFEQPRARMYTVKVGEETVTIPLRDFGDFKEIGETKQEHNLKLWIERDGTVNETIIGLIPATPFSPATPLWVGSGRKKTARATAILQQGTGRIIVNGQEVDVYFKNTLPRARDFLWRLLDLEQVPGIMATMDAEITVRGSSQKASRQAKAVAHALARSLMKSAPYLKPLLKQMGFGGVKVKDKPNP